MATGPQQAKGKSSSVQASSLMELIAPRPYQPKANVYQDTGLLPVRPLQSSSFRSARQRQGCPKTAPPAPFLVAHQPPLAAAAPPTPWTGKGSRQQRGGGGGDGWPECQGPKCIQTIAGQVLLSFWAGSGRRGVFQGLRAPPLPGADTQLPCLACAGKACSFEQLEHVREMQEKLARLHFSLDVCVEELAEDQKKVVADQNLDQLLTNVSAPRTLGSLSAAMGYSPPTSWWSLAHQGQPRTS